jgi:hypothetical protein
LHKAVLTDPKGSGGGGAVPMSPEVARINEEAKRHDGSAQIYLVTIPPNIYPGMTFTANVAGQRFMVNCPESAGPGMRVRIVPPVQRGEPEATPKNQIFEVAVPRGVQNGQPFALVANGQRVLVTCPSNVVPGQKIRFQLPVSQAVGNIQLVYESEKSGWKRTIRVLDLKFQWVRVDGGGNDADGNAEIEKTGSLNLIATKQLASIKLAFVLKIRFLDGNDARMRTGYVDFVPVYEAVVDSKLVIDNRTLISYADTSSVQRETLSKKCMWFRNICKQLTIPLEDGHILIYVRRSLILNDAVESFMGLSRCFIDIPFILYLILPDRIGCLFLCDWIGLIHVGHCLYSSTATIEFDSYDWRGSVWIDF